MQVRVSCLLMGTWAPVSWLGQSDSVGTGVEGGGGRVHDHSQIARGGGRRSRGGSLRLVNEPERSGGRGIMSVLLPLFAGFHSRVSAVSSFRLSLLLGRLSSRGSEWSSWVAFSLFLVSSALIDRSAMMGVRVSG